MIPALPVLPVGAAPPQWNVTISEKVLKIDDEPRARDHFEHVTTFLVDGSTKVLRNRERRAALAQTLAQMDKLRD